MGDSKTPFGRFFDRLLSFGLEAYRLYYGTYRAEVVDVEDPEGMGRIKVRVPAVGHGPSDWVWALPKFPTPCGVVGDDGWYGFYCPPPDKGESVWVEFEVGRPKHAVWSGGWFAKDELPDKVRAAAPRVWSIWSRAQHRLVMVDKDGEEEVELSWMGKHRLSMDKDRVLVETEGGTAVELKADGTWDIRDEKDNRITSSASGIVVEAGQASVVLEDGKAEIRASQFTWAPMGAGEGARKAARGEDLVNVLIELISTLSTLKVTGSMGAAATDPSSVAQLGLLVPKLQKVLVPTFKF